MDGFGILGSQKISECNAVPTRRSGPVGPILATALFWQSGPKYPNENMINTNAFRCHPVISRVSLQVTEQSIWGSANVS